MRIRKTTRRAPLVRRLLAVSAAAVALVFAGAAWAQVGYWEGPTHICADPGFVIGPGMPSHEFSTPVWGEVPCSEVTGTYCVGYVSPDPICVRVDYPTTVSIDVTWANVDTVLALIGPGGSFADDDGGPGTNSRLVSYLVPGDYLLYAGTYSYGGAGSVAIALGDISWAPSPPPVVVYSSPPAWPVYRPVPLPFPRPHYHPAPPPRHGHHPAPPPHRAEPARPPHHPSPPPHRAEPAPPHRPTAPPHHADRPTAPPPGRPTAPPPSARPGGGGDHDRGRGDGDGDRGRGGRDRGEGDRGRGGNRGDRGGRSGSRGRGPAPAPGSFHTRGR